MSKKKAEINKFKSFFPLRSVGSVVNLFKAQLELDHPPDLAFLSLTLGCIEDLLTTPPPVSKVSNPDRKDSEAVKAHQSEIDEHGNSSDSKQKALNIDDISIPEIRWEMVDSLYKKFASQIKSGVDLRQLPKKANHEIIKKVSDVIWSNLSRNYKDKPHLQTLYSYMTSGKLDRFGVVFGVVAACQILGLDDVHLVLSEDHFWVSFGDEENKLAAEVTWHGKGNKDKRGQLVVPTNCWLYLDGHVIVCTREIISVLVAAINTTINQNTKSEQMEMIQQKLLWLLYEKGYLNRYPMGLTCLADHEELYPSPESEKKPIDLYEEAIESNKKYYDNYHLYPYLSLAGHYYRKGRYKEALQTWADAASVIRKYNYTRDDEEIYKEFLDVANDKIPHMLELISPGGCEPGRGSDIPLLQDPQCFTSLLTLYDGLCGWEEGSTTPVLHIGWAKSFVATISKFTAYTRAKVKINVLSSNESQMPMNGQSKKKFSSTGKVNEAETKDTVESPISSVSNKGETPEPDANPPKNRTVEPQNTSDSLNYPPNPDDQIIPSTPTHENEQESTDSMRKDPLYTSTEADPQNLGDNLSESLTHWNGSTTTIAVKDEGIGTRSDDDGNDPLTDEDKYIVFLGSQKMIGLKDLLLCEKLNTSAIQLQLTAQSQVHISKRPRVGSFSMGKNQGEFDFLATSTIATSISGHRVSKRTRKE